MVWYPRVRSRHGGRGARPPRSARAEQRGPEQLDLRRLEAHAQHGRLGRLHLGVRTRGGRQVHGQRLGGVPPRARAAPAPPAAPPPTPPPPTPPPPPPPPPRPPTPRRRGGHREKQR